MKVPTQDQHEEMTSLLKTLQENGYALLYSVGETRVFGRRGQVGGRLVYADPGDELFFDGDVLWVKEFS